MIRVKVVVDLEEHEGYSLAREMEIGLPDEAIAKIAKAIAAQQKMHQTAFGVLLVVLFLGFSCGAVVFNGLCGGW